MKLHFYMGWLLAILFTAFQVLALDTRTDPLSSALSSISDFWKSTEIAAAGFWDEATRLGLSVEKYTENFLHDATTTYASTTSQIDEFKTAMAHVISSTNDFRLKLEARGVSLETISEMIAIELSKLVEEIKEFPPPDQAEHHAERTEMISRILEKIGDIVVLASVSVGIPEVEVRAYFEAVKPHILHVLVLTGDLAEQHPLILKTLLISGFMLAIPEGWFLKHIFMFFGFGPSGVVKGSAAAWAQSRFYGNVIAKGSWFSHLQSAGTRIWV